MPIYEYACKECQHGFETVQSMRDDVLTKCPACGQDKLSRVLFPVHVYCQAEAATAGHLADRNTSRMGTYELQEKRQKHIEAGNKGRKERPKAERPFWRDTDKVNTQLAKLAPDVTVEKGKIVKSEPMSQKAMDYIMNGKV